MIDVKAGNARNSRAIAKFFRAISTARAPYLRPAGKAIAPARAPYLRPAGKAEFNYFSLKLVVHVLSRGCLHFIGQLRTVYDQISNSVSIADDDDSL